MSPIHLVENVFEELAKEKSWGATFIKLIDVLQKSGRAEIHSLVVGTPEALLFNRLRAHRGHRLIARDQGELASIALAAHRPALVLVTEDHGAMRWALDQLPGFPGRVTRTAAWIRAVVERGAELSGLNLSAWSTKVPPPLPEWWSEWSRAFAPSAPPPR